MPSHDKNSIHFHDKAFKTAMTDVRVAKDLLTHYLPENFKQCIDLNSLKIQKGSFVDEKLKASESDILYQVDLLESLEKAYIYLLIEHQSKPDQWMPFRLLKYSCQFADQHIKQYPKTKELPLVYPLVFYNGAEKYPYSMDIFDLFGKQNNLAKEIFLSPFHLIDLNLISDEEIRRHKWSGLMEIVMKHIHKRDFEAIFEHASEIFISTLVHEKMTENYIISMVTYAIRRGDIQDIDTLLQKIHPYISTNPKVEREIMTGAEQLIQRGRQQGIQQGMQQGIQQGMQQGMQQGKQEERAAIVRHLYSQVKNIKKVAQLSGLSKAEVESLIIDMR